MFKNRYVWWGKPFENDFFLFPTNHENCIFFIHLLFLFPLHVNFPPLQQWLKLLISRDIWCEIALASCWSASELFSAIS